MVNVNKLKGKIVEKGINISNLAEMINMDPSTLYRKFNNNCDTLTIKEADLIVKSLELNADEAKTIFFSQFVA
ncbi:helix-turn-helix domain-containing protein [Clostridium sp.]|uniref:helix-turn-helix domain-containing protein n=1 Tax=Clostridium sp. TaxID=1506 RepID=UPI0029119634|nr:helix-turn-helix domain-containing protein [Clostridium sp.]MDU4727667.1 XRE family transcriptional regulator [Clostridium sp.]